MGALAGGAVAAVLSLCVLSRALGDNPLYRFAQSLLVGIALGYVTAVVLRSALVPPIDRLIYGQPSVEEWIVTGTGIGLGVLLLTRFGRQRGSFLANLPLALLFGVGAAIALVGAVRGTLIPQLFATVRVAPLPGTLDDQIGVGVLIALTVSTLLAFTYTSSATRSAEGQTVRRRSIGGALRAVARGAILLAFGVFFAATVTTYISALVARVAAISAWAEAVWMSIAGI
jgi:hypothetical protein